MVVLNKKKEKIVDEKNIPLGIFIHGERIGLLENNPKQKTSFSLSWSIDGMKFEKDSKKVNFINGLIKYKPDQCSDFRFSNHGKKILATFLYTIRSKKYSVIAETKNIYDWEIISETLEHKHESIIVSEEKINKNYIMYGGGLFVKCFLSKDLEKWDDNNSLLFTTSHDNFDKNNIVLIGSMMSSGGIMLFYQSLIKMNSSYKVAIGAVIFDKKNPFKILWRSREPIWQSDITFTEDTECKPLGIVECDDEILIFLSTNSIIITININKSQLSLSVPKLTKKLLIRHKNNPIMSPNPHNDWEKEAVFNPATIQDDEGYVHLIYRAIGSDGVSRLGYSSSKDGLNFPERHSYPIFGLLNPRIDKKQDIKRYDPTMYPSGGSWGGCEDPRAVRINGKIYISFNTFDGWDYIRIGVVCIDEKDFFDKKWKWSKPLLISPRNQVHKNWVIFPEKINGKFAILHSISPKVLVDYIDKLEDLHKEKISIKSHFAQEKRSDRWDSSVRGAGPPPIKTKLGWLLLYHAMDYRDPDRYKLGALLLDLNNPEKVLARSTEPILEPDQWYENDWKAGVVYTCGAIIKDNVLFVYYGGGDKHICVATSPMNKVFEKLKKI